ncbi:hypothetical protein RJ639_003346 [Escallonia herrerae]|uniref:Reverse transcriptase Ty1/copia-type domain-containing protein n=1 Tax=Escallonia herrerae TaxID=1293975 RepID=A0AA88W5E0_9ASTE|nr:hypothetical protein RJ639_003346 [Escallonia herrerae]
MELDEPEDGYVPRTENPEVLDETTDTEIGAGDQQQVPETLNLRRSSWVRKAPDILCLPLDSILYTDSDDMLVAGSSMGRINELKKKLASTFSMKDLGEAKQLLGMRITRDRKQKKLRLSQEEYIDKVLRRFNLHASKPVTTPLAAHFKLSNELSPKNREDEEYMAQVPYTYAVGRLMYAMVSTRPDIAHVVGVVSRFMTNPGKEHWQAVKWILRYLRGTSRFCLCFEGNNIDVRGYVDANHAEDGQLNLEKIEGNKNPTDMFTKAFSVRNRGLLVREGGIPPLVALSQTGTARAKHKAETLLGYLREPRQKASTSSP